MSSSSARFNELKCDIRGQIYTNKDPNFKDYSVIFNGNVQTRSQAVVCPLDAQDVSKIIIFCVKNSLSLSVKAGGYGTAGWAINGDVILDLSRIGGIDIEPPFSDGTYTPLQHSAAPGSKGKKADIGDSSNPGKRRREEDNYLRSYSSASGAVESFLQGSSSDHKSEYSSANIRRRVDDGNLQVHTVDAMQRHLPSEASSSAAAEGPVVVSTLRFPPSNVSTGSTSSGLRRDADPFGYLNPTNIPHPPSTRQSNYNRSAGSYSAASESTLVANHRLFSSDVTMTSHSDTMHSHVYVTFGAGMRQKEIDTYSANHPLEGRLVSGQSVGIPYYVPFSAHPVGSAIMLLGGFGFQTRQRGLSIDNLVEVEFVLADGRIVIVNEKEYPDLWWALRGAGPCFGIATRYKAKAFPVPAVFSGNLIYRFHRSTAPSLIKHFRDCVKGAPRELYANVLLTAGPAGKDSLVVIQMCYNGHKEKGQEFLWAISSWNGEACLLNEVDDKSFLHQQDSVAQVLRGKAGRQWFIRSALITSLPDEVINKTVMQFDNTPVGCTWLFELAGGASIDFEDNCLPKKQREAAFNIAALHQWDMGVDDPRCQSAAEEWIAGTLQEVQTGGPLPCLLGRHESAERTMACYGENWKRLTEIKELYDPTNVFCNTLWPLDGTGQSVDPRSHEPPTP